MKRHHKLHVNFDSSEERFLNELGRYASSTFVDNSVIKEWIKEYRETKDQEILNKILAQVIRFIIFIARRYKTPDIDIRDLIIEAIYGVIEAIDKYYDLNKNQKFITYIKIIIDRRIKDTSDKYKQAVELPKNILSKQGKLKRKNNGNEVIYSKINFQNITDVKSLYQVVNANVVYIDGNLTKESLVTDINRVLNMLLTTEERYIIISMFGLNDSIIRSLEMISTDSSKTQAETRELRASAINKLKLDNRCLTLLSKYLEDFN